MKACERPFKEKALIDLKSEPPTQVDYSNPIFAFSRMYQRPVGWENKETKNRILREKTNSSASRQQPSFDSLLDV